MFSEENKFGNHYGSAFVPNTYISRHENYIGNSYCSKLVVIHLITALKKKNW